MSKQVTFIHAADLHLGAPFRGLQALSDSWAKRLLSAIAESYQRVIDAAIEHQVDFVLIAGDVFDLAKASYADYRCFFDGLNKLNESHIPVYLVTGNHDPYTSWQHRFFEFPPNTFMLPADKPGFVVFEKDGEPLATIAGRGYFNQTWPSDENIAEGITREAAYASTGVYTPFVVGLLHTGLNIDTDKAPTNPNDLLRANLDYWALGHIHMRKILTPENPKIAFSGCIQGRDIGEVGERGILKVTLTENARNQAEFIPTASVVWQRIKLDVSRCTSLSDVFDKIMRELFRENGKAHCEEMCVRITLTGTTDLHNILEKPGVLAEMRQNINDSYPAFFCDSLINKTVQPYDKAALKKEGLFPAVFMQAAEALRQEPGNEVAYLQDEFLKRNLTLPLSCEKKIDTLAQEAENLVLDLLNRNDS
ncbi:MAG: metallophosphoesterase family protein [Raoultibacter sp.]|jgi:exonuclease SbcD